MIRAAMTTVIAGGLCVAMPAAAEDELLDQDGRYRLERSGDHFVRMDTRNGALSICEERSGQLVCRLAADERAAFQEDMDELEENVKELEARVAKLENSLSQKLENALPTEEQFEQTMGYMERFLRNFMGIVKEFEDEPAEEGPAPDRT